MKTQALLDEICERIQSGETLTSICRSAHMPAPVNVYAWIKQDAGFAARMEEARRIGYDAIADDALRIADTQDVGRETEEDATGQVVKVKRADMLGHRKLRVWTRLQLLAKWHPAKYGDRSALELTGADGVLASDTEKAARLASLVAAAAARGAGRAADPDDDETGRVDL